MGQLVSYVKVSGDSKGLSFCPKKLILRLWAAQNRPPSNQIPVTHNTNGFQVWSRHTAPPGGQEVQNVSFQAPFESATLKITSNDGATVKNFTLGFSLLLFLVLPIYIESPTFDWGSPKLTETVTTAVNVTGTRVPLTFLISQFFWIWSVLGQKYQFEISAKIIC